LQTTLVHVVQIKEEFQATVPEYNPLPTERQNYKSKVLALTATKPSAMSLLTDVNDETDEG